MNSTMNPAKYIFTSVFAFGALAFFIPGTTFAASNAPVLQSASTTAELSAALTKISAELSATPTPGTTSFNLSPGQSILQATSSESGGILKISLPSFEHTNPAPGDNQSTQYLAKVMLQFMPCVAAAPSVCVATASTSYPAMRSDLASGQDTGYLHYLITLTNLSTTTATFQVTDSDFIANLQAQVNAIAAQVAARLEN
jgi:hypothetical protein